MQCNVMEISPWLGSKREWRENGPPNLFPIFIHTPVPASLWVEMLAADAYHHADYPAPTCTVLNTALKPVHCSLAENRPASLSLSLIHCQNHKEKPQAWLEINTQDYPMYKYGYGCKQGLGDRYCSVCFVALAFCQVGAAADTSCWHSFGKGLSCSGWASHFKIL